LSKRLERLHGDESSKVHGVHGDVLTEMQRARDDLYYGSKKGNKQWEAAGAPTKPTKACTVCGNENHSKADCKFKDKECSNCGKVGHLKKMCRSGGGGEEKKSEKGSKDAKPKVKAKAKATVTKPSEPRKPLKGCVCGGAGGIGQPLSMLMATDTNVSELCIFVLNIAMVPPQGLAADLSYLDKKASVNGYVMEVGRNPIDYLKECLLGCPGSNLVLVPAGLPRKPGQSRDDLFKVNAGIAKGIIEACAKFCPDIILTLIVNPVISIVPAMAVLYKKKGLNPLNIVGVTTLDCVRANKFAGEITRKSLHMSGFQLLAAMRGQPSCHCFRRTSTLRASTKRRFQSST
jgi:hypothetical protein